MFCDRDLLDSYLRRRLEEGVSVEELDALFEGWRFTVDRYTSDEKYAIFQVYRLALWWDPPAARVDRHRLLTMHEEILRDLTIAKCLDAQSRALGLIKGR